MRTRIVRCWRCRVREIDGSERDLYFKLDVGRLGRFIKPASMPPFEGDDGYVEVLGPMTRPRVLRQVEKGAQTRDATDEERRAIYARRKPEAR